MVAVVHIGRWLIQHFGVPTLSLAILQKLFFLLYLVFNLMRAVALALNPRNVNVGIVADECFRNEQGYCEIMRRKRMLVNFPLFFK